jgi:hypothetical protein
VAISVVCKVVGHISRREAIEHAADSGPQRLDSGWSFSVQQFGRKQSEARHAEIASRTAATGDIVIADNPAARRLVASSSSR